MGFLNPEMRPWFHKKSLVDVGAKVGARTRIWAFAHVVRGAKVGSDVNLCDHTFVEGGVVIGDRVTIKCGVYLWDGIAIEEDAFIGPCVAFTNDPFPRSKQYTKEFLKTTVARGCSIGANATVLPGLRLGAWSLIGAGSVVTRDVPEHALVFGNPARQVGWVCRCGKKLLFNGKKRAACACGKTFRQTSKLRIEEIE